MVYRISIFVHKIVLTTFNLPGVHILAMIVIIGQYLNFQKQNNTARELKDQAIFVSSYNKLYSG